MPTAGSPSSASSTTGLAAGATPLTRLGLAALVLLGEYLALSFLFDARALHAAGGRFAGLGLAGEIATVAMLAAAGMLVLGRRSLRATLAGLPASAPPRRQLWPLAALHLGSLIALVAVSAQLFGESGEASLGLVALWLSLVPLVALSLLATFLSWALLRALVPRLAAASAVGALAGVTAWGVGMAATGLWGALGGVTLELVVGMLARASEVVVVDRVSLVVGTPSFQVELGPECSGFEGMGLIVVFLGAYIAAGRRRLRLGRALAVLPIAVAVTWLLNGVRIAALVLIGSHISPAIALGGFHSKAGWLLFCAVAFGFVLLIERSKWLDREPEPAAEPASAATPTVDAEAERARARELSTATAAYLMPQLAVLGIGLLTGLAVVDFDAYYALPMLAAAVALWIYRDSYRGLWQGVSWEAFAIGVLVYAAWVALVPRDASSALPLHLQALGGALAGAWIAARVVGSVVIVPIVEELAFRGYLLRRLISSDFDRISPRRLTLLSFLGSSLAFGLLHSAWLAGTIAGAAYALAQYRHGRLSDAIVAHAVTNGLIAVDVLWLGSWSLWG